MVALEEVDVRRLIDDFERSRDGLALKIEELRETAIGVSRKWFNKQHLCALREVNDQYFNSRPHLLPNWGIPDDRYPQYRWHRTTVAEWIDTPLWEIAQRWKALSPEEQREIVRRRKDPEVVGE